MTAPKRILVVEDDTDLRRLYRLTLTLAGYQVDDAADGLEALRRLESEPPALVILDLKLPDMSGLAVRQEIAAHAATRDIPIIIVTGTDIEIPDVPCVLRKPVSPESLVQTVRSCLAAGQSRVQP